MRIVHTESSRAIGGQEMRVIEEMEWFQRHGHEVALAAADESGIATLARERGLTLFPVRFRGSFNPRTISRLLRACRDHRTQLIVTHSSRDTFASWPVARMLRIPLLRYQHICIRQRDGVLHRFAWRLAPERIVAVSRSIKDRLIKQKLAPAEKIEVIGEYVDLSSFHPDVAPGDLRTRHHIPSDATVIMQIGMIRPDKGQQVLVRAVDEILQWHPSCRFVFVGSATEPRYLEDLQAEVRA
ncbi:MAG TPA: glycosyltransferase family 4 protein, partial [Verrucomicrobiaceae bacterium]